jgi:CheY-like chemotaxis protein
MDSLLRGSPMGILFVDDEPRILDGIRRMLHARRREWSMHFAVGGDEALKQLAALPIDVIVSDLRMPGMDGATLLSIVKQRSPNVFRIVLSGYAEPKDLAQARPVAHRLLTKPCDLRTLQAAIELAGSREIGAESSA